MDAQRVYISQLNPSLNGVTIEAAIGNVWEHTLTRLSFESVSKLYCLGAVLIGRKLRGNIWNVSEAIKSCSVLDC